MPPKARKSLTLWQSCDSCLCILNAKDVENHPQSCPPSKTIWTHSYIQNQELHSTLEDLDLKGLPAHVSPILIDDIILLSQSAMQLCSFVIGCPVLVEINEKFYVKTAWPTNEGSLTTVRLSKDSLEYGWNCKLTSSQLKVSKLKPLPHLAKEIVFRITNGNDEDLFENLDILIPLIQSKTRERIYYPGFHVKVPFYGKYLSIQLVSFTPFIQTDDVISRFENLNIMDKCFMSLDETEYKLIDEQTYKDENKNQKKNITVGGYSILINELTENVSAVLNAETTSIQGHSSYGILLYGIHGTGKTLIAQFLAQNSNYPVIEIQGMELFSKYFGETEAKLRNLFQTAVRKSPCVIIIDNIETLCPKKGSDQERRVVSTLLSLFDSIRDKKIVVIATSSEPYEIDTSLRRPGRLESEIEIPVPTPEDRLNILKVLIDDDTLNATIKQLGDLTYGFVGSDLSSLVSKAATRATIDKRSAISKDDLIWAHSQVKPSAMREVYVQVPNVKWDDIAGQEDLKLKLQQSVVWPIKFPDTFKRMGIKPPRGVLLYGPPGCSKTLVAKALATETNLNFLSVKGSDIFSKWVGESERAMRDLFKKARNVAPSIIFLDEVDALGGERESSSTGGSAVQERVLSQLLTEMDGVQPLDNVIIIAATNRPDRIDKALLRPGRLDRLIYVPLPSYDTRYQIFALQFKKMPIDDSVCIETLANQTEGYSGAEVIAVCNEAALKALEENIEATCIKMDHFTTALSLLTPRTPKSLLQLYDEYHNKKGL